MNVREFLEQCPTGTTFTRDAVLELLNNTDDVAEASPGQVARILGRSAKYWRAASGAQ